MSNWGAQQWLRVCREATYGVVLPALDGGTAVENTDFWWVRLDSDNAFTPRLRPEFFSIRSADTGNRIAQRGSAFGAVGGSLSTLFYPTRAPLWLAALLTLTSNDLTSYTFDFFDTKVIRRFLGMKVAKGRLTCGNASAEAQKTRLALDLVGQTEDLAHPTTFPAPAISDFPSENPYTFANTAGIVKINNAVRTLYSSLDFTVTNHLIGTRDELPYISTLIYGGRDVSWQLRSQFAAGTDRAAYAATTTLITNQIKWNNGTNTCTLDLKSTNYFSAVDDSLPLADAAYQMLSIDTLFDRTAAVDLGFSNT